MTQKPWGSSQVWGSPVARLLFLRSPSRKASILTQPHPKQKSLLAAGRLTRLSQDIWQHNKSLLHLCAPPGSTDRTHTTKQMCRRLKDLVSMVSISMQPKPRCKHDRRSHLDQKPRGKKEVQPVLGVTPMFCLTTSFSLEPPHPPRRVAHLLKRIKWVQPPS